MSLRISIAGAMFAGWLVASVGCGDSQLPTKPQLPTADSAATQAGASGKGGSGGKAGSGRNNDANAPSRPDDEEVDAGMSGGDLRADGDQCDADAECASAHCNNGLCCADGDCCLENSECGSANRDSNVCEYSATCQGSRGAAVCDNFRCTTKDGTPDDSKCDEKVEADDCGPYKSVFCSGEREQSPPRCPDACEKDAECDKSASCTGGVCVPKPRSGAAPDAPSASCLEKVGEDRCSQCACSKCEPTALACWASGNEMRDGQCGAVLECALAASCISAMDCPGMPGGGGTRPGGTAGSGGRSGIGGFPGLPTAPMSDGYGCFGRECYCSPQGDCWVNPTGACVSQIEAAAGGGDDPEMLMMRRRDDSYALYHAEQHAECLQVNCRAECDL